MVYCKRDATQHNWNDKRFSRPMQCPLKHFIDKSLDGPPNIFIDKSLDEMKPKDWFEDKVNAQNILIEICTYYQSIRFLRQWDSNSNFCRIWAEFLFQPTFIGRQFFMCSEQSWNKKRDQAIALLTEI